MEGKNKIIVIKLAAVFKFIVSDDNLLILLSGIIIHSSISSPVGGSEYLGNGVDVILSGCPQTTLRLLKMRTKSEILDDTLGLVVVERPGHFPREKSNVWNAISCILRALLNEIQRS